jgi:hypothetical protein
MYRPSHTISVRPERQGQKLAVTPHEPVRGEPLARDGPQRNRLIAEVRRGYYRVRNGTLV